MQTTQNQITFWQRLKMTIFAIFPRPYFEHDFEPPLDIYKKHNTKPIDEHMIIRYNNSFLEIVGPGFKRKGLLEAIFSIFFLPLALFLLWIFFTGLTWVYPYFITDGTYGPGNDWYEMSVPVKIIFNTLLFCFMLPVIFIIFFIINLVFFGTRQRYQSIRFCRNNQKVYAKTYIGSFFDKRAKIMEIDWKTGLFCIKKGMPLFAGSKHYTWHLMMLELSEDKKSIINACEFARMAETTWDRDHYLLGQWELIRRYMQEGPQHIPMPKKLLPIAQRQERFSEGLGYLFFSFRERLAAILWSPFIVLAALFRWLQNHIVPMPKWPDYIEQACQIKEDDPYQYEADKYGNTLLINQNKKKKQ